MPSRWRSPGDELCSAAGGGPVGRPERSGRAVPELERGMSDDVGWLAGLSPWPEDGFGLDRMKALLAELGDPQLAYPAVHVVGTNGKSTATVTIEQLLLARRALGRGDALATRAVVERADQDRRHARQTCRRRSRAFARRPSASARRSSRRSPPPPSTRSPQARVDVAVVEAGLGGRHDATNVVRSRVVLLTNVGLEHTDVLGDTVEEIAIEKLAVVHDDDTIVVIPDDTFEPLVPAGHVVLGGAHEAAEAFVGHRIDAAVDAALPGRLERRPGEVRDGAHNADGVSVAAGAPRPLRLHDLRLDPARQGRRRDARPSSPSLGERFVATSSSNARVAAGRRARRARAAALRRRGGGRGADCRRAAGARARRAGSRHGLALSPGRSRGGRQSMKRRSRMRERHRRPHLRARRSRRHRRSCVRRRVYPRQAPSLRPPR